MVKKNYNDNSGEVCEFVSNPGEGLAGKQIPSLCFAKGRNLSPAKPLHTVTAWDPYFRADTCTQSKQYKGSHITMTGLIHVVTGPIILAYHNLSVLNPLEQHDQ